ncbi:MAG: hypothetical protein AAF847_10150 [Bacteroidota bacterium]
MKIVSYILMLCLIAVACKSPDTETTQTNANTVQAAWDEMMVVHDEVMPKMGEITRLKKQIAAKDSTAAVLEELTVAEDGMWNWMHNLTSLEELKKMEKATALQQLKTETATIVGVREQINMSIASGQQLLNNEIEANNGK